MGLIPDLDRARSLALKLYTAYLDGEGIFIDRKMPEDELPTGVTQGSLEHLVFITLTGTIDYSRDSDNLWTIARETYSDQKLQYLFNLACINAAKPDMVKQDMKSKGLSRKYEKDSYYWHTVAVSFFNKWSGDPRGFLKDCQYHAPEILKRLFNDRHDENGQQVPDYPCLKGEKISRVWIRMLRDNVGIDLSGLDEIAIPVDVHILRATLCAGVLRGSYKGRKESLYPQVREVWKNATKGLSLPNVNRAMISLGFATN